MKNVKVNKEAGIKHLTPLMTVRAYCLQCTGGVSPECCDANDPQYHVCPFYQYRKGKGRPSVKIFRKFCLNCMGGYSDLVRDCGTTDCLCYPYRMGSNPAMTGKKGASHEWMRSIYPPKGTFTPRSDGKFQRSPAEPALTPCPG